MEAALRGSWPLGQGQCSKMELLSLTPHGAWGIAAAGLIFKFGSF